MRLRLLLLVPAFVSLLMVVDVAGSAAIRQIRSARAAQLLVDAEARQEPYSRVDWGRRYWREWPNYRERGEPYHVYRVADMHGEFIDVTNGVRRTYSPEHCDPEHGRVLWLFGGSAAWGHGSRDLETIPSWLARE